MFYTGEFVRSWFYGLGEVVTLGNDPVARFLDGRECIEPGDRLAIVPDEVFAAELENRLRVERWLTFRVYGVKKPIGPSLRDQPFDLAAAMQAGLHTLGRQGAEPPDEVPCFILDDLAAAEVVRTPWPYHRGDPHLKANFFNVLYREKPLF